MDHRQGALPGRRPPAPPPRQGVPAQAGKLVEGSWDEAFKAIAKAKPGKSIAAIAGDMVDCETMFAAKALLKASGSDLVESRQTGMDYPTGNLAAVNFNTSFAEIENADAVLIVGSNLRTEAALLNVRIRKAVKRGAKVFVVGPEWETTYPAEFLGDDVSVLGKLPKAVTDAFKDAERPALILGAGGLPPVHSTARSAWSRPSVS